MIIIGIPVRNDKESFVEMINSLLNSTTYFDKIVIIEAESTDGVDKICGDLQKIYPEKIEVIYTKNVGPLKAYNKLFEIAKEKVIYYLLKQM